MAGEQGITVESFRAEGADADGAESVTALTDRGQVALRHYAAHGLAAVIYLGGVGGDWDSPGRGRLYPRLCRALTADGVHGLRVRYRNPVELEEAILDALVGAEYLRRQGVARYAIVGHSFGGAVAAQVGATLPQIRALVGLASQGYGIDAVEDLPRGCASLFVHGLDDRVLSPACSEQGYHLAHEPKELRLLKGVGHNLDEVVEVVADELEGWLRQRLQ